MAGRILNISALTLSLLLVFAGVAAPEITSREYPNLYKSPRAMGMGGAYVAVGGRVDSIFYNPAGLSMMPEKNWEVNIIGLGVEYKREVTDFINDLGDALDTEDIDGDGDEENDQAKAVLDVLNKYKGKNLHLGASDLTAFGRNNGEKMAFGAGFLSSLRVDAMSHQGFGSNGWLEINGDFTYGTVGGLSYKLRDDVFVGAGLKLLHRQAIVHAFTAREIVEKGEDLGDYITEDLRKKGTSLGLDLGGIYRFAGESRYGPAVGLSLLNIGGLFKDEGKIPMTVNLGVSIRPEEIPVFNSLIVGLDYVDLFRGYEQDSDNAKRLRFGGELQLYDKPVSSAAIRMGLYQGYATFGMDLRLLFVDFAYTTYAEEIGAYAGQEKDRRHLLSLNMGW